MPRERVEAHVRSVSGEIVDEARDMDAEHFPASFKRFDAQRVAHADVQRLSQDAGEHDAVGWQGNRAAVEVEELVETVTPGEPGDRGALGSVLVYESCGEGGVWFSAEHAWQVVDAG